MIMEILALGLRTLRGYGNYGIFLIRIYIMATVCRAAEFRLPKPDIGLRCCDCKSCSIMVFRTALASQTRNPKDNHHILMCNFKKS